MAWTTEKIEALRDMWARNFTAREIVAWLGPGFTKNAVVGKAHRLGLERRPHPIRDRALLSREELAARAKARWRRYYYQNKDKAKDRKRSERPSLPPARQVAPPKPFIISTKHTCQNIVSGVGRSAVMCNKPAIEGKPWCPACHSILVMPVRAGEAA